MNGNGLRERQREVRREQLLEVATRLFALHGLEGTTTKDIAREAGVSPGLLYHYYPSTEELLVAVVAQHDPTSRVRMALEGPLEGKVEEALLHALAEISEFLGQRREITWLCMRAAGRFPMVAQALRETKEQAIEPLARFFQDRVASGELCPHDSRRLAAALYNLIAMEQLNGRCTREDVGAIVEAILYGLVPRA